MVRGRTIRGGVGAWVYASVVIWITTMLATLLLPLLMVMVKRGARAAREHRSGA